MTMIEVATIEPAKPGKKLAKVMTTGGESYHIWPDRLDGMSVGGHYNIEFEEYEFNGRTYRKIKKAKAASNGGNVRSIAAAMAARREAPAAKPDDAEWQFVRDMLAVGLRTGAVAFSAHDLRTAIAMLRALWREMT
jgi:hypothetical protein